MSNEFYSHTGYPLASGSGQSVDLRAEFDTIQSAFDKLPTLASNAGKLVVVDPAGAGLTVMGTFQQNVALTNWTPTLTFGTPGDLAVTYQVRTGSQYRLGGIVITYFDIETSAFTWTTSSGVVYITGLPSISTAMTNCVTTLQYRGITKAGYTQFYAYSVSNTGSLILAASGSASVWALLAAADLPSGGQVFLKGTMIQGG